MNGIRQLNERETHMTARNDFLKIYENVVTPIADAKIAWFKEVEKNAEKIMQAAMNKLDIPVNQVTGVKYVASNRSDGAIVGTLNKSGYSAFDKALYKEITFDLQLYDFNATKPDKVGVSVNDHGDKPRGFLLSSLLTIVRPLQKALF